MQIRSCSKAKNNQKVCRSQKQQSTCFQFVAKKKCCNVDMPMITVFLGHYPAGITMQTPTCLTQTSGCGSLWIPTAHQEACTGASSFLLPELARLTLSQLLSIFFVASTFHTRTWIETKKTTLGATSFCLIADYHNLDITLISAGASLVIFTHFIKT